MFQADIILYLQSWATDGLIIIMNAITTLGDDKYQAGILMLILFGVSFRKGMLLVQLFMWTGILTDGLKQLFNLPRPTYVHGSIKNLQHNEFDHTPFTSQGSETFFGGIDSEVLAGFRSANNKEWGFPSGHVSSVVALWGGLALLFQKKFLYWLAAGISVLVALSRMFLGRHFLGDVLGGILLSVIIISAVYLVTRCWGFMVQPLASVTLSRLFPKLVYYAFWFGIPFTLGVLFPEVLGKFSGFLLGLNSAYMILALGDLPADDGSWIKRTARVLISLLLYFSAYGLWNLFTELTGLDSVPLFDCFLESAVIMFVCVLGTAKLCLKLGLYTTGSLSSRDMEPESSQIV